MAGAGRPGRRPRAPDPLRRARAHARPGRARCRSRDRRARGRGRSSLDVLSGVSRADMDSSFGQACGQVTRLLRALLERSPVAVVLDDLHAMDDDTLALLAIVLRRVASSHVVLLTTSRPGPAPALLVERLSEDATVALVALDPLDAAAIEQLVTPTLGAAAAPALVREVASRAEGNPSSPSRSPRRRRHPPARCSARAAAPSCSGSSPLTPTPGRCCAPSPCSAGCGSVSSPLWRR